jgi:uncharacterized DUF497 family protein
VLDEFRWNDWNLDHATQHGVSVEEAEHVVRFAKPPYPEQTMDGKWLVRGRGIGGRFVQVAYALDPDGTVFIIHARPLTDNEKWRLRKRRR